jgi:hypothetical protein
MKYSPNATYTETPDGTIMHHGTGTADQPYERVFALGADTVAEATASSAEAVALGSYSKAYALTAGARAIALAAGSRAYAYGEGAISIAVGGKAFAGTSGTVVEV